MGGSLRLSRTRMPVTAFAASSVRYAYALLSYPFPRMMRFMWVIAFASVCFAYEDIL